jgi:hypothetical protein
MFQGSRRAISRFVPSISNGPEQWQKDVFDDFIDDHTDDWCDQDFFHDNIFKALQKNFFQGAEGNTCSVDELWLFWDRYPVIIINTVVSVAMAGDTI